MIPEKCICDKPGECPLMKCLVGERHLLFCQGKSGLPRWQEMYYLESLQGNSGDEYIKQGQEGKNLQKSDPPKDIFKTFSESMIKWVNAGQPVLLDEKYNQRLEICHSCNEYDSENKSCKICGCYLEDNSVFKGKSRLATEDCPLQKWEKLPLPVISGGCGSCGKKN